MTRDQYFDERQIRRFCISMIVSQVSGERDLNDQSYNESVKGFPITRMIATSQRNPAAARQRETRTDWQLLQQPLIRLINT